MMEPTSGCAAVRAVLPLYVDEGCDPAEGEAVRVHLAGCPSCTAEAARAVRVRQTLQHLPPLQAPEALWAAISERVALPVQPPRFRRLRLVALKPAYLAVAAAALLGIGIGFYAGRPHEVVPQVASRPLRVVDVSAPASLEVAFLLAEHGRTGDAPGFSTDLAVFTSGSPQPRKR